jgi:5-methylcytosine-specific restriction enzyme A
LIPKNLNQKDIFKAIKEIDEKGVPLNRHSTGWDVLYDGKHYPPKYLISIANKFANGKELRPAEFSGGPEANQFLVSLGFEIVKGGTPDSEFPITSHSWTVHSENIAIKQLDKSAFLHHGTGIPNEIRPFFGLEGFLEGENRPTTLLYKGKSFAAHFSIDPTKRLRLFWKVDFSAVLKNELPEWFEKFNKDHEVNGKVPVMRFQALSSEKNKYEVALIFPDFIARDIEAEKAEDFEPKAEGGIKNYYGKRYERNPENRKKAIEIHGTTCAVCRFDFEKVYGERGKGFIEVHHTEPLGSLAEEKVIDPKTDLVPVCSNCHRMIHRRIDHVLSIGEVKELLLIKGKTSL